MMLDPWYPLHNLFDDNEGDSDSEMPQAPANEMISEANSVHNDSLNETEVECDVKEEQENNHKSQSKEDKRLEEAMSSLKKFKSELDLEYTKLKDYAGHRTTRLVHLLLIQKWMRSVLHRNTEHFHPLDLGVHRTNIGNIIVHLNSLLLKLDALELHGMPDARQMRKSIVAEVEEALTFGESLLVRVDRLIYLSKRMHLRFNDETESVKTYTSSQFAENTEDEEATMDVEESENEGNSQIDSDNDDMESENEMQDEDEQNATKGNEINDKQEKNCTDQKNTKPTEVPRKRQLAAELPQPTYEVRSRQDCVIITVELPLPRADAAVRTTLERKPDHDIIRIHDEAGRFRDLALDVKRDSLDTEATEEYIRGRFLVLKVPRVPERPTWTRRPQRLQRNSPMYHQPQSRFYPGRTGFFNQAPLWGW